LNAAIRNANDGISLLQTAEGAMDEIGNMLQRMRELSVQAASDVNNSADRAGLDAEVQQLKAEIDRVVSTTRFNDKKLLDGSMSGSLQVGAKSGETVDVNIANVSTLALGTVSGVATTGAVTEASFTGSQATPTVSQMTFGADGDFKFVLEVGVPTAGGTGSSETYNVSGSVVNGSAEDIVDAINTAIRGKQADGTAAVSSVADAIRATYNGRTVSIENLAGGKISVASGATTTTAASASGTFNASGVTATYTSVTGGSGSSNLLLGSANTAVTSFDVATQTSTTKGSNFVSFTGGTAANISATDKLVLTLVSGGVTTVLSTSGAAASVGAIVTSLRADSDYDSADYYISKNTAGKLSIERYDGQAFTVDATHLNSSGGAKVGSAAYTLIAASASATTTLAASPPDITVNGPQAVSAASALSVDPNRVSLSVAGTVAATDSLSLTLVSGGITSVLSTGVLTGVTAGDEVDFIIEKLRAATGYMTGAYTVGKDDNNKLVVSRTDGADFQIDATFTKAADGTAGTSAATIKLPNGLDIAKSTTLQMVEGPSNPTSMFLDFMGQDTYSFKFKNESTTPGATSAVTVTYDGTASNLVDIAAQIQGKLDTLATSTGKANAYDFSVSVENGRIRIDENNGYGFKLTDFSSSGGGRITASLGANELSSTSTTSALLDDTQAANIATTAAKGLAKQTAVKLQFNEGGTAAQFDTYSFEITDGHSTAVISKVYFEGQPATAGSDTSMLSAIKSALTSAGMDSTITASQSGDEITLTHALGYELKIQNYSSTQSTELKVSAGNTDTSGVTRYLDDNFAASSGNVIRSVEVLTSTAAQDAIGVIDAALEDLSSERSKLGALQNRLTHTIDNLTNISTNTSESRSRIQDTDYGKETAELARAQIIQQAATAMLAQANQSSQSVLSLLQ
jgi:flagellin